MKRPLTVKPTTPASMEAVEETLIAALKELRGRLSEMKPLELIGATRALMEGLTTARALAPGADADP